MAYDCPARIYTENQSLNFNVFFKWDSGGIGDENIRNATQSLTDIIDFYRCE
jgi:hypothetical protein